MLVPATAAALAKLRSAELADSKALVLVLADKALVAVLADIG